MKKIPIIIGVSMLAALTGCSKNMAGSEIYQKSGNTINVNNKRHELYNASDNMNIRNVSNNYGFVRHQKSPVMNTRTANDHYTALDREQLANIISRFSANLPHVHDVATLVTDKDVLIAYQTDSNDRNLTADQVKKTAIAAVPRYFNVYVTDNKVLMRDVENLANLDSTSKNARHLVNGLITQMKKSPQGQ